MKRTQIICDLCGKETQNSLPLLMPIKIRKQHVGTDMYISIADEDGYYEKKLDLCMRCRDTISNVISELAN